MIPVTYFVDSDTGRHGMILCKGWMQFILDRELWPYSVPFTILLVLWLHIQVRRYKFPSEKDLKHINRKLRSCWGLGSHDEYFQILFSYIKK